MKLGRGSARRLAPRGRSAAILRPLLALLPPLLVCAACSLEPPPSGRAVVGGDARRGEEAIGRYGCDGCHAIPGLEDGDAWVGPPLTDWAERRFIAGSLPNTAENLVAWISNPQAVEPGTAMPTMAISDAEARDIAAYLYTLGAAEPVGRQTRRPRALLQWFGLRAGPESLAAEPVEGGDAELGRAMLEGYGCGACHVIPGLRGARGAAGPPLTAWSRRGFIAGSLVNTPDNLAHWIMAPEATEPGTAMPNLGVSADEASRMAAYLFTLR